MLTQNRLKELLDYNPDTGNFIWKVFISNKVGAGDIAGGNTSCGYRHIMIDRKWHLVHRLAWLYIHGVWPGKQIDHIDGNRANNRIENLREATHSENQQNRRCAMKNSQTGFLGVTLSENRNGYQARILVNGKSKSLGTYSTPELAHEAYLKAKREFHPGCTI